MPLAKIQSRGQVTLPGAVRRAAGLAPGDTVSVQVTGPGTISLRVLPRLTLREALEIYPIVGPIDQARDRERWQNDAARDVFGSRGG